MRKNKGINPGKSTASDYEDSVKNVDSFLRQNKIYFPSHFDTKL